jgi:hypothetical protein
MTLLDVTQRISWNLVKALMKVDLKRRFSKRALPRLAHLLPPGLPLPGHARTSDQCCLGSMVASPPVATPRPVAGVRASSRPRRCAPRPNRRQPASRLPARPRPMPAGTPSSSSGGLAAVYRGEAWPRLGEEERKVLLDYWVYHVQIMRPTT